MAQKYVQKKKGVLDTDDNEIITPKDTVKWRKYERWLRRKNKDSTDYPPHIFNQ